MRNILVFLIRLPRNAVVELITVYQHTLSPDHPPSLRHFVPKLRWAREGAIALINLYQATLSPDHGPLRHIYTYGYCRHEPTCSEYGKQTIRKKGLLLGSLLTAKRLLSCHPWAKVSDEKIKAITK